MTGFQYDCKNVGAIKEFAACGALFHQGRSGEERQTKEDGNRMGLKSTLHRPVQSP